MKIKFSLFVLSLFVLLLLVVNTVSAQVLPKVYIKEIEEELLGVKKIPVGQKIMFKVKICVDSKSSVPLKGFWIYITLIKPNGHKEIAAKAVNDHIGIGKCKVYEFRTGTVANIPGKWKYVIEIFTRDCKHKLAETRGTFEVVSALPKVKIEVLDIIGYAAATSMIVAGLALALSRIIK